MSDENDPLFAEFSPSTYDEWLAAAAASLKGKPVERLLAQTYEGITLQPVYGAADVADLPHVGSQPGQFPYVRGTSAAGYGQQPWLVAQEMVGTAAELNAALKHDLARGQTAVNLIPTQLESAADFAAALDGIDMTQTSIFVRSGSAGLPLAALLLASVRQSGGDVAALRGSLEADPLGEWAQVGTLPLPLEKAFDEVAMLVRETAVLALKLDAITLHGYPYADGGASAVQELAFVLGTAVATVRALQERGLDVDAIANSMQFAFSIGGDFFMEIAKLRAARLLWAQVVTAFGGGDEAQKMVMHGRTARANKTLTDAYVNMLRGTTEAFAAAVGGVDSLHVAPFDEEAGAADEFSRRIARNVQIILQEEANLTKVIDPAGGAYFVEWLTDAVAQRAWTLFQEIERRGGMAAALQSGWVQGLVAETAVARAQNLATRKDVLVGTNLYAAKDLRLTIDDLPLSMNNEQLAINNSPFTIHNLATAVAAAEQGATMGQMIAALRTNYPTDKPTIQPIPVRRAAEPFERLREAANAAAERPRVFLATMGPLRQHKARADFARGFFEVGGFEVVYPAGFDGVDTAVSAGVTAVVICSTDETYPEIVPPLTQALKAANADMAVIVAGYPKEHVDNFKGAGVDEFIYVGADCLAINQWLHKRITK
ncbi:MAG: acyl-CoA mutase large subunit family protein [Ardenticatenaceae bacterium]|nr:acyl-CoA mutase large subunit family protein [Ardenticatenaceae bacterium]MCB8992079.1 acyl-CoA mutase large subunit family protein [Ardenticatenaceae bacterium]MCB9005696.1 acyl-CoA mutase large subunit family protein [Ardenticatenaceae bacterium]